MIRPAIQTGPNDDRLKWPRNALHELTHRSSSQLPALDGLRAIAVLLVICDHWRSEWVDIAHLSALPIMNLPVFHWGWTGVDLFFVLSGFLIGKQLWAELYRSGTIKISDFVIRRGLRIWPLYYITMVVLVVLNVRGAPSWPDWVMLSNYVPSHYGRGWSLSTEEQFYVLMPAVLLLLSRLTKKSSWPFWIAGLIPLVAIARFFTFQSLSAQGIDRAYILGKLMYAPFHLHCEPLLAGLLIAWAAVTYPRTLEPEALGVVAWRTLCVGFFVTIIGLSLRAWNRESFPYVGLAAVYSSALCIALTDRSWVTGLLRWRLWHVIARLSFGMYLNHLMIPSFTRETIEVIAELCGNHNTLAFCVGWVVTVMISAAIAIVTFVFVEIPGLSYRDRLLARRASLRPLV